MSDAQDDGVRLAERPDLRLGVLGPWRRWRDGAARERIATLTAWTVGAVTAGLLSFLLGPVFGEDDGVGSAVSFAVCIFVVMVYLPELTHLWRKIDDHT
jgi:hypothetical protein